MQYEFLNITYDYLNFQTFGSLNIFIRYRCDTIPFRMSTGETSLSKLLQTLTVTLHPETYTFISLPATFTGQIDLNTDVQMLFREPAEGSTTLILKGGSLEQLQTYTNSGAEISSVKWRMLTLNVYSSLEAVGFMAVVSKVLAERGVSCNVVAGWFHDHVFVQHEKADEAVEALKRLAEKERSKA